MPDAAATFPRVFSRTRVVEAGRGDDAAVFTQVTQDWSTDVTITNADEFHG